MMDNKNIPLHVSDSDELINRVLGYFYAHKG